MHGRTEIEELRFRLAKYRLHEKLIVLRLRMLGINDIMELRFDESEHPRDDDGKFIDKPKNIDKPKKTDKSDNSNALGLSTDEEYALKAYKSSESYKINDKLRKGEKLTEEEEKFCEDLDSALDKMPKYEGDLNRGLTFANDEAREEFLNQHSVGSIVTYPDYTSATKDSVYDENMEIQCFITDAKKGADLDGYDNGENEVLYKRNARFVVTNYIEKNGYYNIYIEEVP